MKRDRKAIIKASATMIGTIIGVGMFGVPYAVSKSGFLIGLLYLIGLGLIMLVLHLFYTDIVLNTKEKHRYVGYARLYLGKKGRGIAYASALFGIGGSLIAYLIIGGEFLHALINPYLGGEVFSYQVIFFLVMAFAVLFGLRLVSIIEIGMTVFLLLVMAVIFIFGFQKLNLANLTTINHFDIFLPYGVILFAIGGLGAIPEIKDVLKGYGRHLRQVVIWSTIIPVVLITIFTLVVVGSTGVNTTEESILGLAAVWGDWMLYVGALFGFLAITTSALVLMTNFKECFMYDFKIDEYMSWFIVTMVPFIIFLAGAQDFIGVIGFTGAIFGGINGILLSLMYLKLRQKKKPLHPILKWPKFIPYVVMFIFGMGIVYEVLYQLFT
jgi:tyrosine-specific transport protein